MPNLKSVWRQCTIVKSIHSHSQVLLFEHSCMKCYLLCIKVLKLLTGLSSIMVLVAPWSTVGYTDAVVYTEPLPSLPSHIPFCIPFCTKILCIHESNTIMSFALLPPFDNDDFVYLKIAVLPLSPFPFTLRSKIQ